MADPKVYLDKSVNADKKGRQPIKIEIYHSGIRKRTTLFSILPKEWDSVKSKVRNNNQAHVQLNYRIEIAIRAIEDYIFQHQVITGEFNIKAVINPRRVEVDNRLSTYLMRYADSIKGKASIVFYKHVVLVANRVDQFTNGITVDQVTEAWINQFKVSLSIDNSTFSGYMKKIRKALKIAQKDNIVVCTDAFDYKVRIPQKIKHKLSIEQFQALCDLHFSKDNRIGMVRDIFLLQIYCRGMRIGDILVKRQKDIVGDRLINRQGKTGGEQDIKLGPEALEIIDRYKDNSTGYLIPFLKIQPEADADRFQAQVSSKTAIVNAGLDTIAHLIGFDHSLTSHVARHTYAVLGKKMGIPIYILSKHLGHSTIHTTEVYLAELMETEVLDEAADDIFRQLRERKD